MLTTGRGLRRSRVAVAALVLFGCATFAAAAPSAPRGGVLQTQSCTVGRASAAATCGTYTVFEDRAGRRGRTISLHFIVLKAAVPTRTAVFVNPGGPGAATLPLASYVADGKVLGELAAVRSRYDVLLVDDRGMGASHALDCTFAPAARPELYFAHLWPAALVRACRARLSATSDLRAYTTRAAADDLDELRAALGYAQIAIDGGSYGTYFALVYASRHRAHLASAVLSGVVPPHISATLSGFAGAAQTSMDHLIGECRADALCRARYPAFSRHFAALAARFARGPLDVTFHDPKTKRTRTLALSKEVFADSLRHVLYDNDSAAYVPYVVERAYDGDTAPLATMVDTVVRGFAGEIAQGALLSYSCAEYVPSATSAGSAGTFMGDARVAAQKRACAIWDVPPVPHADDPIRTSVPVLMISGTNDPATPPRYSQQQLAYLARATRVLIRGASHGTETACGTKLATAFLLAASAKGLDATACSAVDRVPRFKTSMAGL